MIISTLKAQDTIWIQQHTVIEMGDTMIIPKNTVVFFTGNYQLAVIGTLKAQGSDEFPIIFTSAYDSTNPATTSWQGIEFAYTDENAQSDSSIFEHCLFQYAHVYQGCGSSTGMGGAIRAMASSRIRFSNCRFENNFAQVYGGAVYLQASNAVFDHCVFDQNRTDSVGTTSGGCMAIIGAAPILKNCIISNSWSSSVGGGIIAMNCDSTQIVNCEFFGNSGTTGGAMFIANCSYMRFVGNLFHHNDGRYFGGGFALKNASFRIINCTITDNFGGQGGGVYCSSGVNCSAYNTIFCHNEIWETANGPQIYIAYQESTINFFHCLVVDGQSDFGGSGSGVNFHGIWDQVIEDDIEFESCGDNYFFCLPENSPCINAGSMKIVDELPEFDLRGHQRIVNQVVDLGACESDDQTNIYEKPNDCFTLFPNPANDKITIDFNPILVGCYCSIFDIHGRKVNSFLIQNTKSEISIAHLSNGIYFLACEKWQQKLIVQR
ncbi:MAG: T9SS type A sorting domain-containing protein [Bacteroidales bacterium]|nr:T9SS type A sorting domain-containing protein [Bacteroidales bacterium]